MKRYGARVTFFCKCIADCNKFFTDTYSKEDEELNDVGFMIMARFQDHCEIPTG